MGRVGLSNGATGPLRSFASSIARAEATGCPPPLVPPELDCAKFSSSTSLWRTPNAPNVGDSTPCRRSAHAVGGHQPQPLPALDRGSGSSAAISAGNGNLRSRVKAAGKPGRLARWANASAATRSDRPGKTVCTKSQS